MKHFAGGILILIGWILSVLVLSMQLAYFLSFHYDIAAYRQDCHFVFDPKILWWQGNDQYFRLMVVIIGLGAFLILIRLFTPSKNDQKRKAAFRRLTKEEKLQYAHLATVHEAKKGLQRIRFDRHGNIVHYKYSHNEIILGNVITIAGIATVIWLIIAFFWAVIIWLIGRLDQPIDMRMTSGAAYILVAEALAWLFCSRLHFRDYCDYVYDPAKRLWNWWLWKTNQPDSRRFNTLKEWEIGGKKTVVRAGLPIITKWRTIWLDATDSHNMVIGTTNSGKTFSIIHILIQLCRMAGESMIINDLKGELHRIHRKKLIESGYKIVSINFIDPERGDSWNPFDLTTKAYRKAQAAADAQMTKSFRKKYLKAKKEYLLLNGKIQSLIKQAENTTATFEQNKIINQIHTLMESQRAAKAGLSLMERTRPQPNFSEASDYLQDVAMAIFPQGDQSNMKADNTNFWNMNGMRLLVGIVWFLLEYEYIDDKGNIARLAADQINFKNFQMTVNDGFKKIRTDINSDPDLLLKFYLDEMREKGDNSVMSLESIIKTPEETRGSIEGVFATYISLGIINGDISRMLSYSSFNYDELWDQKIAVFLIAHDEKTTYYPLVVLFMNQMMQEVARIARTQESQRLKYPLNIIFDEFGIAPAFKDLNSVLSAARSKGIRFTMVVQDFSQLEIQYNHNFSKMIQSNVMNVVYLLGGSKDTQKDMVDMVGDKLQWNKEKGNYEVVPIVTKGRLGRFSLGEAVLVRQRHDPFITRYRPFNKYIFFKSLGKQEEAPVQELRPHHRFSLEDSYDELCRQGENAAIAIEDDNGAEELQRPVKKRPKKKDKPGKPQEEPPQQDSPAQPQQASHENEPSLNIKDMSQMDE